MQATKVRFCLSHHEHESEVLYELKDSVYLIVIFFSKVRSYFIRLQKGRQIQLNATQMSAHHIEITCWLRFITP